jgi:hypothetical protein
LRLGAIRLTGGFPGGLACVVGGDLGVDDLAAPDDRSRFGAHDGRLQRL